MFRIEGCGQNFFKILFTGKKEKLGGFKRLQNLSGWG